MMHKTYLICSIPSEHVLVTRQAPQIYLLVLCENGNAISVADANVKNVVEKRRMPGETGCRYKINGNKHGIVSSNIGDRDVSGLIAICFDMILSGDDRQFLQRDNNVAQCAVPD
jgi:hypothetical protein